MDQIYKVIQRLNSEKNFDRHLVAVEVFPWFFVTQQLSVLACYLLLLLMTPYCPDSAEALWSRCSLTPSLSLTRMWLGQISESR